VARLRLTPGGRAATPLRHHATGVRERRLDRDQQEQWGRLRAQQQERRQGLESEGAWNKKNARWQKQRRQQQQDQFSRERERLQERHDREWNRSGY
jgi:hypothetical protein